jgi:hypothetical protein
MKVELTPTQDIDVLKQNLQHRASNVEKKDGKLLVETDNPEKLGKVPGIEEYSYDGESFKGLQGRPVQEQAYAKIESREDAVKCLLATIEGYDLRILDTEKEWDLRQLKKYNPDIKHIKQDEPLEVFDISKAVQDIDGLDQINIELPDGDEEMDLIYREMLTS